MRFFLRSKIHKATVTDAFLDYEGSVGIDEALMERIGILNGEKVLIADSTTGARLETYVVKEEKDSGKIAIYGAAAHLIKKGDKVIIMGFELSDEEIKPKKILVDKNNKFVKFL